LALCFQAFFITQLVKFLIQFLSYSEADKVKFFEIWYLCKVCKYISPLDPNKVPTLIAPEFEYSLGKIVSAVVSILNYFLKKTQKFIKNKLNKA